MFEVEAGADEKQQIKFVWPYHSAVNRNRKSFIDNDGLCLEYLKIYLACDIPVFIIYCVYLIPGSSLLIVYRLY